MKRIFTLPQMYLCHVVTIVTNVFSHTQLLHYNFPRAVVTGNSVLMHMVLDFSMTGRNSNNEHQQVITLITIYSSAVFLNLLGFKSRSRTIL
jgi:hypothetical protein